MANHPSKLDQLRALREANAERSKPNPFEDVARGRDPAPTSSGGKSEQPTGAGPRGKAQAADRGVAKPTEAERGDCGTAPRPPEAKRKTGRPRLGEVRDKPWEAAGMSRSTWYRRKAEERKP